MVEKIKRFVLRHFHPVNPAHVFPPADNLTHKTLELVKFNFIGLLFPLLNRRIDDFLWRYHFKVHRKRKSRMVQRPFVGRHRILIGAKQRQAFCEEKIE